MVRKLGQSTLFVKVDFKGLTSVAFTDFFTSVMSFTTKLRFVASWLTSAAAFKAIKVIKSMLKSAPNRADNFANFRWAELLKSWLSVVGRNRFTGYYYLQQFIKIFKSCFVFFSTLKCKKQVNISECLFFPFFQAVSNQVLLMWILKQWRKGCL